MSPSSRDAWGARPRFAPTSSGDPIARLTEWGPLRSGGANFCTHVLRDHGGDRLSFRPTVAAITLLFVLLLLGVAALVSALLMAVWQPNAGVAPVVIFTVGGLIFTSAGAYLLWSETRPIVFDRQQSLYHRARSTPPVGSHERVELGSIHALQIVSEYIRNKDKNTEPEGRVNYYSYELNLVLKDGERINVVDHGNLDRLRKDAAVLARFLGVPLWDAVA